MPNQITLTITMTPQGQVMVNGPIENKLLCYGLLECARDAIKDYADKAQEHGGLIPITRPLPTAPNRAQRRHPESDGA